MNTPKFFDFSEKKTKKFLTIFFYTLIGFAVLYFFLKKRNPQPVARSIPSKLTKEDRRPRISISGSLITPQTLQTLTSLGKYTKLHLIFKVSNSEEESKILTMLKNVQTLSAHHILFCETDIGYKSIIRQLSPKLHIEDSLLTASEMSSYLNAIAIVSDKGCESFYQLIEFQDSQSKILRILADLR